MSHGPPWLSRRSALRAEAGSSWFGSLGSGLPGVAFTERDRSILTMLYRHRVFTTDQLAARFTSTTSTPTQHRLTTLYKLRLHDRFQPPDHRYASLPYHYVLDELGALAITTERGRGPRQGAMATRQGAGPHL